MQRHCACGASSALVLAFASWLPAVSGYRSGLAYVPGDPPQIWSKPALSSKLALHSKHASVSAAVPSFDEQGGPTGNGHMTFSSAETTYLDGGEYAAGTSTTLTVIAVVRFTILEEGLEDDAQGIMDFGNEQYGGQDTIVLSRTEEALVFTIKSGSTFACQVRIEGMNNDIADSWITVVARYSPTDQTVDLQVRGDATSGYVIQMCNGTAPDSSSKSSSAMSRTYVGTEHTLEKGFKGDLAGLVVVEDLLSDTAALAVGAEMSQGQDVSAWFSSGVRTPDHSCNPSMCRTTDGGEGFDCWADGEYEKFECAEGYDVVETGQEFEAEGGWHLFEFTCCPSSTSAESLCPV